FEKRRTWVIGDTPLDVINGRNIGARTIAVATGAFAEQELLKHEPDAVLPDFNDRSGFIRLVKDG
ncbi:MAG TPA: HAD family hydrolase, partial [Bacteroidetes bacterium]|nr:HAD family hydrolase [Bacteroidota bacterium]